MSLTIAQWITAALIDAICAEIAADCDASAEMAERCSRGLAFMVQS